MLKIGVIGYSGELTEEKIKNLSEITFEIGKMIAKNGWILYSGGRNGIMEIVSKGAKESNGVTVGILPWEIDGNQYIDYHIKTGLDFSMRSFVLVKSVDVIVSIGGEIGTAIELLGAYANGKPIILMNNTGGWTDRIKKCLIENTYLDNRKTAKVYSVNTIEELEKLLKKMEVEK
ncbi:hypothetical protein LN42_01590 [Marinitoga sp. 1137]|uniref:TIGR00725 family protein n=1 Tax=Marinitoga sp. 1137 TaxID=1545835 RepID=UPI000950ABBA|nr:TIGR00725 family protein [Marinitoga sp. 1137]APT75231.1 hypothetical protein LN42_01590 [Marinitoga sp. 1137]